MLPVVILDTLTKVFAYTTQNVTVNESQPMTSPIGIPPTRRKTELNTRHDVLPEIYFFIGIKISKIEFF